MSSQLRNKWIAWKKRDLQKMLLTGVLLAMLHSPITAQPDPDSLAKKERLRRIDSIKKEIVAGKEDTSFVKSICQISILYSDFWYDSAFGYARRAQQLAEKLKYPRIILMGLTVLGELFNQQKNYDSAVYYFQKGLDISIANEFIYEELHDFRRPLNNNYFLRGDLLGAWKISKDGLATAEKVNDRESIQHFNNVLGHIMMKVKNFELSRQYFTKDLELTRERNDKTQEAHAFLNFAELSIAENKMPDALSHMNKVLHFYQAFTDESTRLEREAFAYNKLAEIYKLMQQNTTALQYCLLAIKLAKQPSRDDFYGNKYDIAAYHINAGDIYNRLQQPDSALFYLKRGLAIAHKIRHREEVKDAYEQLSSSFAMLKKFDSAYSYQVSFARVKDSLLSENKDLESRYEIEQKKTEIEFLQKSAKLSSTIKNILIAGSGLLFIIILLIARQYRLKRRAAASIQSKNIALSETLEDLRSTQAQLVQSEKMASLGELTAGIAHEIQNPLNFVNNFSDINKELLVEMKQEIEKGNIDEVKSLANDVIENHQKINQHGKRADAIVKGMLQHSRSSSGVKEQTDINGLADEYLRLAYHGLRAKNRSFTAKLETDFDSSIGKVNIVAQDIGRVILNLITNAFYAVTEKRNSDGKEYEPTVTVTTKHLPPPLGDRGGPLK